MWWMATNKGETSLKNHLKWARLKIKGVGSNVPTKIIIEDKGLVFIIPIWNETPMRVVVGENGQIVMRNRQVIESFNLRCRVDYYGADIADHTNAEKGKNLIRSSWGKETQAREGE